MSTSPVPRKRREWVQRRACASLCHTCPSLMMHVQTGPMVCLALQGGLVRAGTPGRGVLTPQQCDHLLLLLGPPFSHL